MTQKEQMDRFERSLRLFLKRQIRDNREPRMTADKLGAYLKALQERDSARELVVMKPGDSEAHETLRSAQEVFARVRNELTR
ncbi:MAG: hypothetical protein QOJ88_837 [Pyrinomonadaceae bacterium]|jgi:hypothetical protein|nr:hypothetical protein [Pyrinomonadaceae bacterium]